MRALCFTSAIKVYAASISPGAFRKRTSRRSRAILAHSRYSSAMSALSTNGLMLRREEKEMQKRGETVRKGTATCSSGIVVRWTKRKTAARNATELTLRPALTRADSTVEKSWREPLARLLIKTHVARLLAIFEVSDSISAELHFHTKLIIQEVFRAWDETVEIVKIEYARKTRYEKMT